MRPIPYEIKIEIFRRRLEGLSIPQISILYNVSVGTIFSIIKEEIKKDEHFRFS
jgi:Mor family transcriptional regulator